MTIMKAKEKHARELVMAGRKPYIAVDLDGTLAEYHDTWGAPIGKPVPAMLARVYEWRAQGKLVKLFTARAEKEDQIPVIKAWLEPLGLGDMEITNVKDLACIAIYDDRAIQVEQNTGRLIGDSPFGEHRK